MTKEDYAGPERRRHKRIDKKFVVKLRVYSNDKTTVLGRYDMVSLHNISAGGALITYSKEIKVGSLVDLDIRLSTVPEAIKCLGKIVRVETRDQSKTLRRMPLYYVAVRFIDTKDKKEEEIIKKFVEEYHSIKSGAKR